MYAAIRGTELYFDIDGPGLASRAGGGLEQRPTVILLHGGPGGDHSSFRGQIGQLRDVAQLIYVDHRGSGHSRRADSSTYDLDNNVDDVEALRQYLGLERVTVLGSSYGGMVALAYAIRYPAALSNLILLATAASHEFLDDAKRTVAYRGSDAQKAACERLWDGQFESLDQLRDYYRLMGPWYSRKFDSDEFESSWASGIRNYKQLNLGFGGFLRTFDLRDELSSIRCPTLVVAGRHDWICPPRHSELIAERVPRAHLKVFAESAHSIAKDEPEELLAVLRGFLTYADSGGVH